MPYLLSFYSWSSFSPSFNDGLKHCAIGNVWLLYFTFNFVSSALTALRQLRKLHKRASGVCTAQREGKDQSVAGSRVEIIVATLIIYLPPALTSVLGISLMIIPKEGKKIMEHNFNANDVNEYKMFLI